MNLGEIEFTATITLTEEELSKIIKSHIEKAIDCEVIGISYSVTSHSTNLYERYTSYKFKDVSIKIKPKNS